MKKPHLKQGDKPEVMLKAVVEKAVRNGLKDITVPDNIEEASDATHFGLYVFLYGDQILYYSIESIIFSHSFAKAYWGEDTYGYKNETLRNHCVKCGTLEIETQMKKWEYHLQQAVLSDNPLLYYYERL